MDFKNIGKGLLRSKKFQLAVGTLIVAAAASYVALPLELVLGVLGIGATAIVGQAQADSGKVKAEIEATVALAEIAANKATEAIYAARMDAIKEEAASEQV